MLFLSGCGGATPTVSGALTYKPPFAPVTFAIDTNGTISVQGNFSIATPIGTFGLEANIADSLQPQDNTILLIIRHKQGGKVVDDVYKIQTGQDEVRVVTNGTTVIDVTSHKVFIDASSGSIQSISVRDTRWNDQSNTSPTLVPTSAPAPIPTPTPTPTPSPTPPPPGTILYQADWSNGLNGWKGSPDWKVLNGKLLSDGSNGNIIDGPTIVPPYQVSNTADYAIEANIQLISYGYVGEGSSSFGISLRGTSTTNGWQGYTGGLLAFNEYQRYMQITGPDIFGALKRGDFDPGSTSSHTYRVEVKGNDIKLLIDGSIRLEVTDNRYLSGAQVGFWCFGPQISVSSFKVFAL